MSNLLVVYRWRPCVVCGLLRRALIRPDGSIVRVVLFPEVRVAAEILGTEAAS